LSPCPPLTAPPPADSPGSSVRGRGGEGQGRKEEREPGQEYINYNLTAYPSLVSAVLKNHETPPSADTNPANQLGSGIIGFLTKGFLPLGSLVRKGAGRRRGREGGEREGSYLRKPSC